jgi:hypothetical protein
MSSPEHAKHSNSMEFLELQYNFWSTSFDTPKTPKNNLVIEFVVIYLSLPSVTRNNLNSGAELLHPKFWSRSALGVEQSHCKHALITPYLLRPCLFKFLASFLA